MLTHGGLDEAPSFCGLSSKTARTRATSQPVFMSYKPLEIERGRSLQHLIETVTSLKDQGVAFKSLTEKIDTSTATGLWSFKSLGRSLSLSATSSKSAPWQAYKRRGPEAGKADGHAVTLHRAE